MHSKHKLLANPGDYLILAGHGLEAFRQKLRFVTYHNLFCQSKKNANNINSMGLMLLEPFEAATKQLLFLVGEKRIYIPSSSLKAYPFIITTPIGSLRDKRVSFTGPLTLERASYECVVQYQGGSVVNSVDRNTDYIVTELEPSTSIVTQKLKIAKKNRTAILGENTFLKLTKSRLIVKDPKASMKYACLTSLCTTQIPS